jgi:glyoxylase-like metal-dependent hydrolase (beta-lactamase superfamily II)
MPRTMVAVFILCSVLLGTPAFAELSTAFNASPLVKLGDEVRYGSYLVRKIGDGIYQINDPGDKSLRLGALGVDMYLICGTQKALMVDLGNDYIDGYAFDLIKPRQNAAQELRNVVYGLAGKRTLEIAITHAHPDHAGMTPAFANEKNVTIWLAEGEVFSAQNSPFKNVDSSTFTRFVSGQKFFDLGGGRIVHTFLIRGHTQGSTVFLLDKDMMLFTGDALGSGFGQGFRANQIQTLADDTQKLVDYIKSNFSLYQRSALRVYTGHTWQNGYSGYPSPNIEPIDVAYLDWRFIQNMNSCAHGILRGQWLIEGSGLHYVKQVSPPNSNFFAGSKGYMVYGIGSIVIPIEAAYEAAGLKMPD